MDMAAGGVVVVVVVEGQELWPGRGEEWLGDMGTWEHTK